MISISDLVSGAVHSVEHEATFQSGVRQFIDDRRGSYFSIYIANDLAQFITEFRETIENWITRENTKARRKTVNNLINDVSRISRDTLGYTLVCVKRKPKHEYAAKEMMVKPLSTSVPSPSYSEDAIISAKSTLEQLRASPEMTIQWLVDDGHELEHIARIVVGMLKGRDTETESPF